MVEIREILESKEMIAVIEAIEALKHKYTPKSYEVDRPWPVALALTGKYQADVVLKLLLDDKVYYTGYKEVLAASFGGWLVAPHYPKLREGLMVQAALSHMDKAEATAGLADTLLTLERDIAARYLFTGTDFLTEIYDCLGGYQAFSIGVSLDEVEEALGSVEKDINTAARAIAFLHHGVDRFGRPGFDFLPSLNKAVSVLDELKASKPVYPYKDKYVSRSLLHQRWSQNKQTLALMYAASTIRINRKTLLQLILGGFFSYNDHSTYLELWVGRARYVSEHIFSRMADPQLKRQSYRVLGEGKVIDFAPPKLDRQEEESFRKAFRNHIKS